MGKKKNVALVVFFTGLSMTRAWGIDIYSTDKQTIELHAQGMFVWNNHVKTYNKKAESLGHRVRIVYTYRINDDWKTGFNTEWSYDPFYHQGKLNETRRWLYYYLKNKRWGDILVGHQESVIYRMVGSTTDWYLGYGTIAQGSFNGYGGNNLMGYSRPVSSIAYYYHGRPIEFAAMYGFRKGNFDPSATTEIGSSAVHDYRRNYIVQLGTAYHINDDWSLRFAWAYTNVSQTQANGTGGVTLSNPNINGWLSGFSYTHYPWYHAVVYGEFSNLNGNDYGQQGYTHARGIESYSSYSFHEIPHLGFFKLYGGINQFSDLNGPARKGYIVSGVALITLNDHLAIGIERKFNISRNDLGGYTGTNDYQLTTKYYF